MPRTRKTYFERKKYPDLEGGRKIRILTRYKFRYSGKCHFSLQNAFRDDFFWPRTRKNHFERKKRPHLAGVKFSRIMTPFFGYSNPIFRILSFEPPKRLQNRFSTSKIILTDKKSFLKPKNQFLAAKIVSKPKITSKIVF